MTSPPPLFSDARTRAQRDRAARLPAGADFIGPIMAEAMIERLAMVKRDWKQALVIGAPATTLAAHLRAGGTDVTLLEAGDERARANGAIAGHVDTIELPLAQFDLILWPGGLDCVNDVPVALVRLRALLAPDGLLLGAFVGDGSVPRLRRALLAEGVRAIPRHHPQVDLAAMGNLLQRTGFALPVVDVDAFTARYADFFALVRDLRAAGLSNRLANVPPPLTRSEAVRVAAAFVAGADADGRIAEEFRIVHFSGWAPHPDQPRPARRGSATASLAEALRPPATTST